MERLVADFLRTVIGDTRIDIRAKNGTKDRGDIAGLRTVYGADVVVEVKNHARLELGPWIAEAEVERGNADAGGAIVVHKRKGVGTPAEQYVTMTLGTFAWLLQGGEPSIPTHVVVLPVPEKVAA